MNFVYDLEVRIRNRAGDQIYQQVEDQVLAQTEDQVRRQFWRQVGGRVGMQVLGETRDQLDKEVKQASRIGSRIRFWFRQIRYWLRKRTSEQCLR